MNKVDWNKLWRKKNISFQPKHGQALELLSYLIKIDNIKSVCDFGCGQGVLLKKIKEKYPYLDLYGSDITNFSKQQLEQIGINYFYFNLIEDRLKRYFDLGILVDVLEHFYNPLKVLDNLSTIKYLIVIVPNFNFITERIKVLKGDIPFQMRPERGGHIFWFNKYTLNNLIFKSNFKIIKQLNYYPKKIKNIFFIRKFDNIFATSFGVLLKSKL